MRVQRGRGGCSPAGMLRAPAGEPGLWPWAPGQCSGRFAEIIGWGRASPASSRGPYTARLQPHDLMSSCEGNIYLAGLNGDKRINQLWT